MISQRHQLGPAIHDKGGNSRFSTEITKRKAAVSGNSLCFRLVSPDSGYPLWGTNISHLGKRKIIFKKCLGRGYVSSLEGSLMATRLPISPPMSYFITNIFQKMNSGWCMFAQFNRKNWDCTGKNEEISHEHYGAAVSWFAGRLCLS